MEVSGRVEGEGEEGRGVGKYYSSIKNTKLFLIYKYIFIYVLCIKYKIIYKYF